MARLRELASGSCAARIQLVVRNVSFGSLLAEMRLLSIVQLVPTCESAAHADVDSKNLSAVDE
jgi:hypothetical protein